MAGILNELTADHRNMAKILKLMEAELDSFTAGEAPDYDLILLVLDYLQDFPEQIHHPKEDLVYRQLAGARGDLLNDIDDIEADHEALAQLVAAFRQAVERILNEEEMSREVLIQRGRELLDRYWVHMREEEERLFPLAARSLGDEDWAEIALAAADGTDPVFTARQMKHFSELRSRILAA